MKKHQRYLMDKRELYNGPSGYKYTIYPVKNAEGKPILWKDATDEQKEYYMDDRPIGSLIRNEDENLIEYENYSGDISPVEIIAGDVFRCLRDYRVIHLTFDPDDKLEEHPKWVIKRYDRNCMCSPPNIVCDAEGKPILWKDATDEQKEYYMDDHEGG
jgi:hypothetical protein